MFCVIIGLSMNSGARTCEFHVFILADSFFADLSGYSGIILRADWEFKFGVQAHIPHEVTEIQG